MQSKRTNNIFSLDISGDRFITVVVYVLSFLLLFVAAYNFKTTLSRGLTVDKAQGYVPITKFFAEGQKIYTFFVDRQPPGLFVVGAPFIWLFGSTVIAAKLEAVFYAILYSIAVGIIGFTLSDSRLSGIFAACLTAFFVSSLTKAYGINVNYFAALFVGIGFACCVQVKRAKHPSTWALLGGLIFGIAPMIRPTTLIEIPALLWMIYILGRNWRYAALCLLGIIGMIVILASYGVFSGTFNEMYYASVTANLYYGTGGSTDHSLSAALAQRFGYFVSVFLPQTLPILSGLILGAGAAFVWHMQKRAKTSLVVALLLWSILAAVDSAVTLALHIRYFLFVIAPFIALLSISLSQIILSRWFKIAFCLMALLLIIPTVEEFPNGNMLPTRYTVQKSDYQNSINFLDQNLDKQDCLLIWGPAQPIFYFTDYKPCSRVAVDNAMTLDQGYDLAQWRMWYLQDILQSKPKILALGGPSGPFPQFIQLLYARNATLKFTDYILAMQFYSLDWSKFHESNAEINGEIDLRGYDLLPGFTVSSGSEITVIPYWQVAKVPTLEYQGYIQLVSLDHSHNIVSVDAPPSDPYTSTKSWTLIGDIVVGHPYKLKIPEDLKAGDYALIIGLYGLTTDNKVQYVPFSNRLTGEKLPFIELGKVTVTDNIF